jgi:OTU domain-containing protein 6
LCPEVYASQPGCRCCRQQFGPFLLPEDEGEDPETYYEKYCYAMETTAVWGGHLELTALAGALKRHIQVCVG